MAAATFSAGCEEPGDRRHLEADFLDLLIASERVGHLVDAIRDTANLSRYVLRSNATLVSRLRKMSGIMECWCI